jgi:hypothetical protein
MNTRELILLTPYRLPGQNTLMLSNEDMSAFLHGYLALWHPAALSGAEKPPRVSSPYDHEQPVAGHLYAVPESPPLLLPEDWDDRVQQAGAFAFRVTDDREATQASLLQALGNPEAFAGLTAQRTAPFFGIGFGHLIVETLCEAMEHQSTLAAPEFWQDVQQAVAALTAGDADGSRRHLQSAADRLLAAREVLYPVNIHLLDLYLLDQNHLGRAWPASFELDQPLNVVAAASVLERLGREQPERLAALRERVQRDVVEVCGGPYVEREDPLLPLESQVWNLLKGLATYRQVLERDIAVFARKRFGLHPHVPLLLQHVGLRRALLLAFDDAVLPSYRTTTISWSAQDGKQVDAFTRSPHPADSAQTWFHWAHYLHKTIMTDHGAMLALLHGSTPAAPWYRDLLELSRFGPVLGQWTTFSRYFNEVSAGEYAAPAGADEFHGDFLSDRVSAPPPSNPVSGLVEHVRSRRRLDTAWALAGLHRGLTGRKHPLDLSPQLAELEDRVEVGDPTASEELTAVEQKAAAALADRLLARASAESPGFLVLNPCSFVRRVALELDGVTTLPHPGGPIKASQMGDGKAQLVVEVPALGFAWLPRDGVPGPPPTSRMRLADERCVRNEFFEAEVDATTGGLRAIYDHRTRINRMSQQLIYNPGSIMLVKEIRVTSAGPALGEIVSEGAILDEQEKVLASFRQRFRAWLGRPVLDLRIEIRPENPPTGYPWYAYYGARFAWRDERATLFRGVLGMGQVTTHNRPVTPEYLEIRSGRQNTVLLPGGLPFHQRHGARMLDVVLVPEGETATVFDLALGLDREHPAQTALGMVTPTPVVTTAKGPPHVGATGWLFHLDAPNLLLTSFRPAADGADADVARMLECTVYHSQATFRCVRDPKRAVFVDAWDAPLLDANVEADSATFEVAAGDLVCLKLEFE